MIKRSIWESLIIEGLDDWVPILEIEVFASRVVAADPSRHLEEEIFDTIEVLMSRALMIPGTLDDGFHPWSTPPEVWKTKLKALYASGRRPQYEVWLCNNEQGDGLARAILEG